MVDEGRALLLVANKLDALGAAEQGEAVRLIKGAVENKLPEVAGGAALGIRARQLCKLWDMKW